MNNKLLQINVAASLSLLLLLSYLQSCIGQKTTLLVIDYKSRCLSVLTTERYIDSIVIWKEFEQCYFEVKAKPETNTQQLCLLDIDGTKWSIKSNQLQRLIECDTMHLLGLRVYMKEQNGKPSAKYYNFSFEYKPCLNIKDSIPDSGFY